ncbi:MAG: MFS transporter [Fibrobacter sp.]|nr:MFS transporter [Fibrobacter sp.]OQC14813.1 MAG: Melibiose carrier protein [Firmicutes bacterium ADurb.Bin080]
MQKLINKIKGIFEGTVERDGGQVPRKELFRYGLGIAGQNISCGVSPWILFYSNTVLGVSIGIIGTIITITRVWDAVNDPLMGSLIDRHRFKSNEKLRPFLKYAALVAGISLASMFFLAFFFKNNMILFSISILVSYFIYDMSFTVQDLSMWGMTSIMTPVSTERSKLAQLGRIFATVGGLLPGLIQPLMSVASAINFEWKYLFLIIAVVMGFGGMLLSTLSHSAKERVRTPKPDKNEVKLKDNLNLLFKNKMVMLIMIGSILSGLSMGVGTIYFFIFKIGMKFTLPWGMQIDSITMVFIYDLIVGLPATLAMLFAGRIKKLFGSWKNVMVFACIIPIFMRIICYFISWEGSNIFIVMALMALAGIPAGLNGIAMTSLLGDSLDYMELKTGMRGEGITFAAQIFSNKIGGAVNTGVFTLIMLLLKFDTTHFEEYKNGLVTELAGAANFSRVAWELFILGPIVGLLFNLIPLLCIKYSEHHRNDVELKVRALRAARESANALSVDDSAGSLDE